MINQQLQRANLNLYSWIQTEIAGERQVFSKSGLGQYVMKNIDQKNKQQPRIVLLSLFCVPKNGFLYLQAGAVATKLNHPPCPAPIDPETNSLVISFFFLFFLCRIIVLILYFGVQNISLGTLLNEGDTTQQIS